MLPSSLYLAVALIVAAYLLGALPFAFLIGKAHGIDIRLHGSGNIGATNVARVVGKGPGLLCFGLDFLKGWAPSATALALGLPLWAAIAAAVAAILGHSKSVFLSFKGGKSVATGAGAVVALAPLAGLGALLFWAIVFAISRIVSLASIAAAASLPVWMALTGQRPGIIGFGALTAVYVVVRHRENLARLRAGTEPRFGEKPL